LTGRAVWFPPALRIRCIASLSFFIDVAYESRIQPGTEKVLPGVTDWVQGMRVFWDQFSDGGPGPWDPLGSVSSGNAVHATQKFFLKHVFFQNNTIKRELNLHYSGLAAARFLGTT